MSENQNPDFCKSPVIHEPIAIVGLSCRFAPDLNTPEEYWSFLTEGSTSVSEMPARRWDPYLGSSPEVRGILNKTTRKGSFLSDIEGFDAEFFQITPREAEFLDPQQRIMLEISWEALNDAGLPPTSLGGSCAGVFVSANSNDYGRRLLEDLSRTGAWAVNGTTFYGIANRISYFLDLRGPSLAVDTACAGSLSAIHLACQSLQRGESPIAIVGGINIMSTPTLVVALDAAQATSPDGRSKAFDAAADGYGRGEGAGVVVLKRLSDALRDGDRVRAVIAGSGMFQDGRSDGMMAPNGAAQEAMLRSIYQHAGIDPATVHYVEAHGTGTPRGDLEETNALGAVFGPGRSKDQPLLIGSVKPNIGHVEAASGIAGVIKVVLAMEHERLPPSLHERVNADLKLEEKRLEVVKDNIPWPSGENLRTAGVSSYGVGGSIGHLVLQEAPKTAREDVTSDDDPLIFPLSSASEAGVKALAGRTAAWLRDRPTADLSSVAHTLTRRRSHLPARAAVIASTVEELAEELEAISTTGRSSHGVLGQTTVSEGPVWVFSGHGAQWTGMGRELLASEPVFANVIDQLASVFREELGWTPREIIEKGGPWTVTVVQAMTFAMQSALAAVWREWGVTPSAVIGHSVGEIAAAVAAGALELTDAARFACRRSLALERVARRGGMALVGLSFTEATELVADRPDVVPAIAASPRSTVLSGDRAAVKAIASQLEASGVETRAVKTDVAFHSPHVDEVLEDVAIAAGRLSARKPDVPLYSSALADPRSDALREGVYWETNLRQPVRFVHAVEAALADGHRTFLEVSSHPVVSPSITETIAQADTNYGSVVFSLRRDQPEKSTLLHNLAKLFTSGVPIDFGYGGDLLSLPSVAWQHRDFWIFPDGVVESRGRSHDPESHTLLGGVNTIATSPIQRVWQTQLDMSNRPYAQSHKVVGVETVPASVVLNSFIQAASSSEDEVPGLSDIVFRTPLAATPPRDVQVILEGTHVKLASRIRHEDANIGQGDDEWINHTSAVIDRTASLQEERMEELHAIRERCTQEWSWQQVDQIFLNMGVDGYTFPWVVEQLHRGEDEQLCTVTIDHTPKLHPSTWTAVVDAALTVSGVLVLSQDSRVLRTSSSLGSLVFQGGPPPRIHVHTRLVGKDTIDMVVATDDLTVVCEARGLKYIQVQDASANAGPQELVHHLTWDPVKLAEKSHPLTEDIYLIGDEAITRELKHHLDAAGVATIAVSSIADLHGVLREDRPGALIIAPSPQRTGESAEDAAERCAFELIEAAQHISALQTEKGGTLPLKLWTITQGVRNPRGEDALSQGVLWGVSRIIGGERSDFWGGVIDIDSGLFTPNALDPATASIILELLNGLPAGEDVVSIDRSGAHVARLARIDRPATGSSVECRPDGTYLVTGGLGALGLEVANHLVERGARRLVLVGRSGLPSRGEWDTVHDPAARARIEAVRALEAQGTTVRALAIDVSDERSMREALDPVALDMPPIAGVVHAAGVVSDALVDRTEREGLRTTIRGKAGGAMVLHRMFPPGSLDFFALFSSCGQLVRLTGQASYAAANSFLDTLAALRHASGYSETVSLAWAQWKGKGMGETTAGTTILEAEARGMAGISAAEAFRCWSFADRFEFPYYAILRVLPERALPIFAQLTEVSEGAQSNKTEAVDWSSLPADELGGRVITEVHEQVAAELNMDPEDIPLERPLVELGVDSVLTVALRVRLTRRFGVDLPPTILWSNPTVGAVSTFLMKALRAEKVSDEKAQID